MVKTLDCINSAEYSSTTEVTLKSIKLSGITPEFIGYNPRTHKRKVFLKCSTVSLAGL